MNGRGSQYEKTRKKTSSFLADSRNMINLRRFKKQLALIDFTWTLQIGKLFSDVTFHLAQGRLTVLPHTMSCIVTLATFFHSFASNKLSWTGYHDKSNKPTAIWRLCISCLPPSQLRRSDSPVAHGRGIPPGINLHSVSSGQNRRASLV